MGCVHVKDSRKRFRGGVADIGDMPVAVEKKTGGGSGRGVGKDWGGACDSEQLHSPQFTSPRRDAARYAYREM